MFGQSVFARPTTMRLGPKTELLRSPSPAASERGVLISLANRVRRLCPDHRDPERFHIEKDAIEHELRQLARQRD